MALRTKSRKPEPPLEELSEAAIHARMRQAREAFDELAQQDPAEVARTHRVSEVGAEM